MDASWWPAVVAVVVLAVIAGLADSFGRVRRAHRRPEPGEVWWAVAPSGRAGAGAGGDRVCLVLKAAAESATVAWITVREDGGGPGAIPLPPGSAGAGTDRPAYLETGELAEVAVRDLRRKAGPVDTAVWDRVRHLSDT